jgi:large subunit ribosomal protein L6
MSRLAKQPIAIPAKTEVSVKGGEISVTGPKGSLKRVGHRLISVEVGAEGVQVATKSQTIEARAALGTYASHVRNMIEGVNQGFAKKLLIEGVGYKWDVAGKTLNLSLGFSHPVKVAIPEGLTVTIDKGALNISGFDKELVGQFAANVRALKVPEPYKGKGIRYSDEVVRRKQGKKAA